MKSGIQVALTKKSGTKYLESRIQDCLVFPYMGRIFNAGRCLFRFRRLRYCGKQQKLFEDFKNLAVSCGTKREFCLETLLACICWRMGCKNISLTMWWQGTDCNNNKSREVYFWRIHPCIMGYVNTEKIDNYTNNGYLLCSKT